MPSLGRFASADTLVPDPTNPQSYNRYSYVLNNPLKYIDPSGHSQHLSQDESNSEIMLNVSSVGMLGFLSTLSVDVEAPQAVVDDAVWASSTTGEYLLAAAGGYIGFQAGAAVGGSMACLGTAYAACGLGASAAGGAVVGGVAGMAMGGVSGSLAGNILGTQFGEWLADNDQLQQKLAILDFFEPRNGFTQGSDGLYMLLDGEAELVEQVDVKFVLLENGQYSIEFDMHVNNTVYIIDPNIYVDQSTSEALKNYVALYQEPMNK